MTQFFIPPDCFDGRTVHVSGPQARRLLRVMRFKAGDRLKVFDGARRCEVRLEKTAGPDEIQAEILQELPPALPRLRLSLFFALLPKDRTEAVLEKGTEVGVSEFFPIYTERTNVRLPAGGPGLESKLSRWKKIVEAAVEQSESSLIPAVYSPMGFVEALDCRPEIPAWVACPPGIPKITVSDTVILPGETAAVRLFIGPEGGFSPEELDRARKREARFFALGDNVLRSETAAIVSSSLFLFS